MSHNLSQPEEVELVLMEMAEHDITADMPEIKPIKPIKPIKLNSMPQSWPSGYVSAYRAAHIKAAHRANGYQ